MSVSSLKLTALYMHDKSWPCLVGKYVSSLHDYGGNYRYKIKLFIDMVTYGWSFPPANIQG